MLRLLQSDSENFVGPRRRSRKVGIFGRSGGVTDRPELLYSSLKATDIHYTLLSDSRLEAAKAFHVAYHVDGATLAKMREYGVDLEATTGTKQHELPVPSVFIIDTSGTIRFVYSNPDYKIRLGADALTSVWNSQIGLPVLRSAATT